MPDHFSLSFNSTKATDLHFLDSVFLSQLKENENWKFDATNLTVEMLSFIVLRSIAYRSKYNQKMSIQIQPINSFAFDLLKVFFHAGLFDLVGMDKIIEKSTELSIANDPLVDLADAKNRFSFMTQKAPLILTGAGLSHEPKALKGLYSNLYSYRRQTENGLLFIRTNKLILFQFLNPNSKNFFVQNKEISFPNFIYYFLKL